MASIAEWIEKIKTAIYGEEVRGAIWQSLDAMNTQVDAINVDSAQIEQNKQDIATNTAAITALNSSLGAIVKETTATDGSVTFKFTGNRYTAILMIQSNILPGSGIYGLIFKKGAGSSIKSLAGNESLPTIDSNGSITFNMVSWSKAILYTPAGGDFS